MRAPELGRGTLLCACCCPKVLSHRSFHNSSRRIAAVTPVADEEKGPKRVNRVPEAMQLVSGAAGAELWTSRDCHAGGHGAVVHIEFLPASVSGCFWFFVKKQLNVSKIQLALILFFLYK